MVCVPLVHCLCCGAIQSSWNLNSGSDGSQRSSCHWDIFGNEWSAVAFKILTGPFCDAPQQLEEMFECLFLYFNQSVYEVRVFEIFQNKIGNSVIIIYIGFVHFQIPSHTDCIDWNKCHNNDKFRRWSLLASHNRTESHIWPWKLVEKCIAHKQFLTSGHCNLKILLLSLFLYKICVFFVL